MSAAASAAPNASPERPLPGTPGERCEMSIRSVPGPEREPRQMLIPPAGSSSATYEFSGRPPTMSPNPSPSTSATASAVGPPPSGLPTGRHGLGPGGEPAQKETWPGYSSPSEASVSPCEDSTMSDHPSPFTSPAASTE